MAEYNGWTNYETWRVNLEIAADLLNSMVGEQTFDSVASLASYVQDVVSEVEDAEDVDWVQIASAYEDDLVEK